jgi:hypothetical protein
MLAEQWCPGLIPAVLSPHAGFPTDRNTFGDLLYTIDDAKDDMQVRQLSHTYDELSHQHKNLHDHLYLWLAEPLLDIHQTCSFLACMLLLPSVVLMYACTVLHSWPNAMCTT